MGPFGRPYGLKIDGVARLRRDLESGDAEKGSPRLKIVREGLSARARSAARSRPARAEDPSICPYLHTVEEEEQRDTDLSCGQGGWCGRRGRRRRWRWTRRVGRRRRRDWRRRRRRRRDWTTNRTWPAATLALERSTTLRLFLPRELLYKLATLLVRLRLRQEGQEVVPALDVLEETRAVTAELVEASPQGLDVTLVPATLLHQLVGLHQEEHRENHENAHHDATEPRRASPAIRRTPALLHFVPPRRSCRSRRYCRCARVAASIGICPIRDRAPAAPHPGDPRRRPPRTAPPARLKDGWPGWTTPTTSTLRNVDGPADYRESADAARTAEVHARAERLQLPHPSTTGRQE